MKHFNRTITVLVFIFLYIPMIVLAVASFNTGTDIASFKGFTFRQYANLKHIHHKYFGRSFSRIALDSHPEIL